MARNEERVRRAWRTLERHADRLGDTSLRALFEIDAARFESHSLAVPGLLLDYSKQLVDAGVMEALLELADAADLPGWRAAMFQGEAINSSEGRAVLHTALRAPARTTPDRAGAIAAIHGRMAAFSDDLQAGCLHGATGKALTDVVMIGIGGSHLGPELACRALADSAGAGVNLHFIANLDPRAAASVLAGLSAECTFVLVASKSFTTLETDMNARNARQWLQAGLPAGADGSAHLGAITANPERARDFGVRAEYIFDFWDWVGGRYSLWSAIGLPVAAAAGMHTFEALLAGAAAMDEHFLAAAPEANLPLMLGLLGIWNSNFLGCETHAVVPYDERLRLLPEYLQQLDMESNGKRVQRDGRPVAWHTAPILWGGIGTNVQHAFFQLLHQGTRDVTLDFLLCLDPPAGTGEAHRALLANGLAQSRALMWGKTAEEVRATLGADAPEALVAQRSFQGGTTSNTLLLDRLDAHTLGALLALYEHKVFVQGIIWNINSFDQWGVELGKVMADEIDRRINDGVDDASLDSSTRGLIAHCRRGD